MDCTVGLCLEAVSIRIIFVLWLQHSWSISLKLFLLLMMAFIFLPRWYMNTGPSSYGSYFSFHSCCKILEFLLESKPLLRKRAWERIITLLLSSFYQCHTGRFLIFPTAKTFWNCWKKILQKCGDPLRSQHPGASHSHASSHSLQQFVKLLFKCS